MINLLSGLSHDLQGQLETRIYAVPVLLALGVALYFSFGVEPALGAIAIIVGLLMTVSMALSYLRHRGQGGYGAPLLLALACFWVGAGFAAAKIRTVGVQTPILSEKIGPTGVFGTITALEQLGDGRGQRILLTDLDIRHLDAAQTPYSVRLSVRKAREDLRVGQRVSVFAAIEPPSPPATPGGFDFRRHAYFNKIGGYGYVLGPPRVVGEVPKTGIWGVFEQWRNRISAQVAATLPPREGAMVTALLTGERAAIAEDDWDALRHSGLAHLLAISGSNVDMVALIVFFIARLVMAAIPPLALYHPIKKYAAVAAFVVACLYVALILPSTPTTRALVTIGIVLLAVVLDRSPISLRLVCVTAILVLLIWPEQLLSPSFQLSFAAVTALVAVFEWVAPWLSRVHRDSGFLQRMAIYLLTVCVTTVVATVATAPISAFHFQNLAIYGVIANLLAVPIMTFIAMPVAILCYLVMPFMVPVFLFQVLGATSDFVLKIAHGTAALPGADLSPAAMPLLALIAIVAAGLMLCLMFGRLKILAVIPALAAAMLIYLHRPPDAMIAPNGKVAMVRGMDGVVTSTSGRYARRLQEDWARYWGSDAPRRLKKGEAADILLPGGTARLSAGQAGFQWCPADQHHECQDIGVSTALSLPLAVYLDDPIRVVPVRPLGAGRPWQPDENL